MGIEIFVAVDLCQRIQIDLAGRVAQDVDRALVFHQRLEAQREASRFAAVHGIHLGTSMPQTNRNETEPRSWNRTRTLSPGLTRKASVTPPVMMKLPAGMC